MSGKSLLAVAVVMLLGCALTTRADTVTASGAGPLPGSAQDLTGVNVTQILGTIPDTTDPLAVAMFKINVTDYLDFSALTVGMAFGIPDTVLFLFDSSGNGVLANDDISGSNTLSCLPSAGAGNPCVSVLPSGDGPTADGTYFLAITRSANMPLDVSSNEIFSPSLSTDVVGPSSGVGPVTGWDGGAFTSPDTDLTGYDILLTGTSPMSTPEPATVVLLAMGLILILAPARRS